MKDHEIRDLVNQLRDIAINYHGSGQLREQIARAVRAAMLQAGNSPVQPYCRPAQNSVAPEQSPIDHGYRPDCECTGCKATARICAELAGWIPVSERTPDKNQDVLISVNFDSDLVAPLICSARYTGSTFRRGDATVKPGSGVEQATHWMPLPAAPQEVNNG